VIEVTRQMLEEKSKQARGNARFVPDKICDALLELSLPEFRKLPGIVQTWAGLYATARRHAESLKEVA
jgi:hypothetical protein